MWEVALNFLWIVEGKADVYPRIAPTMEWDTCAAQCILEEYGGKCVIFGKKCSVVYNKQKLLNPFFIASVEHKLLDNLASWIVIFKNNYSC